MKYANYHEQIPQERRAELNAKVLCLIESGQAEASGITRADIFNAYTGIGGLHGLNRADYENYHKYSEKKKQFENGQFFTPPALCELVMSSLRLSECDLIADLIADLTCGMGNFFNYAPVEANAYGCELDVNAYKVARYLYPEANLELGDVRTYKPEVRFDYVVGNPPFHLKWWVEDGSEMPSQLYYCVKAAELLKPLGILALVVPRSFLADPFLDGEAIREMEKRFRFLGQTSLPDNAFSSKGVSGLPTKLQFWQRRPTLYLKEGWRYSPGCQDVIPSGFDPGAEAHRVFEQFIMYPKADLEQNKSHILLELARANASSASFTYRTQKLLYQIKAHPATKKYYAKCCEYLHRFYTQRQPDGMDYREWQRVMLTEAKVLSYLRRALQKQNREPERDVTALVKRGDGFVYKAYSAKAQHALTGDMKLPVPVYQAVLDNTPEQFPGFERLLRRKRREYDCQEQQFSDMAEEPSISAWLKAFTLWDAENEEYICFNDIQCHDINLMLQKRYGMLQWEQGSGKTLAAIAAGLYQMEHRGLHSTWVVSSAISIRNNWDVVLPNYGLSYVFVERLADLENIKPGDFVLITLNKLGELQKRIKKWIKCRVRDILLVLDESDEITNPYSVRAKASLSCFRRCRMKLLTTGTSTRNNISEFAPQLELLYNNSVNMTSWCRQIYSYDKDTGLIRSKPNPYYGRPIPAYKQGYSLFSASHLPEKPTVFGMGQRTQDIYNASELNDILGKTVITRTFEEVTGKDIRRIHQVPLPMEGAEKAVYDIVMKEFSRVQWEYFSSTGNSRKDAMLKLMQ